MIRFIIEILLLGVAVSVAAFLIPGIQVDNYGTAILAGILIGIVNATLGTVLRILTFPITIITLGLFSFIITVLMVMVTDTLLSGFQIDGFIPALLFAIVLSLIKMVFGSLMKKDD